MEQRFCKKCGAIIPATYSECPSCGQPKEKTMTASRKVISFFLIFLISIVALIGISFIDYYLHVKEIWTIHGFNVFGVIPIGAICIGALLAGIIRFAQRKFGSPKDNRRIVVLGTVLGFLIIPIVFAFQFATARLDERYNLYYSLSGDHISNFTYKDKQIDYLVFIRLIEENTSRTLTFKYNKNNPIDLGSNMSVNYFFTVLEMAACGLGSFIVLVVCSQDNAYCESCQRYYKSHHITNIPVAEWENEIGRINDCINKNSHYIPSSSSIDKTNYFSAVVRKCPNCNRGVMTFQLYRRNEKGESKADSKIKYQIEVTNAGLFLGKK
ncbi:MAG: hypothetical protein IK016_11330 [Lachnospiraceae bacterium]|nr:hypothetical protein [Lachnospiraceae bacterium]